MICEWSATGWLRLAFNRGRIGIACIVALTHTHAHAPYTSITAFGTSSLKGFGTRATETKPMPIFYHLFSVW
uniref:Putative secreted protein n=1 Tax=Anopheles marajoara TaxID=58244 RepID=A0A2M4CE34_9DIPT